jgi:lambda family phage portal protein
MVQTNVVGSRGMTMQAQIRDADGTLDRLANDSIESQWKSWSSASNCDITKTRTWTMIQQLAMHSVMQDGEAVTLIHRNRDGMTLELVDPELLPIQHNRILNNGNHIRMSIEFNSNRQPVAYHILDNAQNDMSYGYSGRRYIRISADDVVHTFIPEFVGQSRGRPALSTALMRMNMLQGYEDASLTNARIGASKMGFFESETGDGYVGDDANDGTIVMDAEPGVFEQLPMGVKFQSYDPSYPTGEFGDFVKANLRGIASGLGVDYSSFSNDLEGVSFSSGRIGMLEMRETWKTMQEWFAEAFCQRIFQAWLQHMLTLGKLTVVGKELPMHKIDKFKRVNFQGRRWDWVDPKKDMEANRTAIELGLKSRSEIIRDIGRDPDEVWREIQKETELLIQMGIIEAKGADDEQ